ncbi:hypothetical protein, partial [Rhizobium sp.]|uniref:hypothetical protein n=1 Tax=Rhizobium sp. TaxID=391 RepID=UPI00389A3D5F
MRVRLMLPHEDAVARVLRAALEVIGGVTTTWIVMIGERMTRVPPLHPLAMLGRSSGAAADLGLPALCRLSRLHTGGHA